MTKTLDLITIGRSSVDLYGDQVGGRLEDMGSFSKYIGGSPTNIACGTARLGLKSAVITGVGDEHMGRFIVEQLAREGVDTRGVKVDPERLTALVLLGIRDDERFPLIFYRENCADMGLTEDDIDEGFIAEARAVLATGTHLSHPRTEAAVLKALTLARKHGARTALDIDYRPNLWGVAGHGEGESRFVESAEVTAEAAGDAAPLRPDRRHRGGVPHRRRLDRHHRGAARGAGGLRRDAGLQARRARAPSPSRARSRTSLDDGQTGPGFPIEVFNVLGAGDGFFSGLLRGWLDRPGLADEPEVRQRLRRLRGLAPRLHPGLSVAGRARLLPRRAASSVPTSATTRRSSRCTGRPTGSASMAATGRRCGSSPSTTGCSSRRWTGPRPRRSAPSSSSASEAALEVPDGRPGYGILCDNRLGRAALHAASGTGLWIGRPCEWPGSRPLTLEPELGSDYGGLARMGARGRGQGALLLPPGRHARDARGAGGDGEAALGGLAPQPARVPARDHPLQGRRRSTTTPPRR